MRIHIVGTSLILIALLSLNTSVCGQNASGNKSAIELGMGITGIKNWGYLWVADFNLKKEMGNRLINDIGLNFGHVHNSGLAIYESGSALTPHEVQEIMTRFQFTHHLISRTLSNKSAFDLNLGMGYSIMYNSEVRISRLGDNNASIHHSDGFTLGFNLLFEPEFIIKEENVLSLRFIAQNFLKYDNSIGMMT